MTLTKRGFTLIELLGVIAIISLLIAILLPSLGQARRMARQAASSSAIRQLVTGYTLYYTENSGQLMWGYPPAFVNGQALSVTLPSGQTIPSPGSFGAALPILRYPARLAPYEQNIWRLMYNDTPLPTSPPNSDDTVFDASQKAYLLSLAPSFGLNSVFLGGDFSQGGFSGAAPNYRPSGAHVAYSATDVRRPSEMIVFIETKHRNRAAGILEGEEGFFRASPPVANGRKWKANGQQPELIDNNDIGLPEGRWSDRIVTGFFDGHVEPVQVKQLDDMRLWANKANSPDYDFVH